MAYSYTSFLSFGGGVQSTAIAIMLAKHPQVFEKLGYFMPRHIIFADTGAEPDYVYENVENVFKIVRDAGLEAHVVRGSHDGVEDSVTDDVLKCSGRGIATPPYYVADDVDRKVGMLRRSCTEVYKIRPIQHLQRSILGYKPRQRIPKDSIGLWLGISIDEARRARMAQNSYTVHRYPLIDLKLTRSNCATYCLKTIGYVPEKSACFFCPYKSQAEWELMREKHPAVFDKAVAFDKRIRTLSQLNKGITKPCYLHRSALPLDEAITAKAKPLAFEKEDCTGHCFL